MPDLLLELFSEEIPARMQRKAAGDLRKLVTDALVDGGLTYEGAREYWTPRRLTLDLRGLTARSADIKDERKGPRTDAPQKALEGFLRGAGLSSVDQAKVRSDPKKGDFYVAVINKPGRDAQAIIAEVMPGIIANFPWPKSMRWGEKSRDPGSMKWVRPLQSILCLFASDTEEPQVVPFEAGGIASGNTTRGHRFHAPDVIKVRRFDDYIASLEKAKVVLDAERRKEIIKADAKNLAFAKGLELVEDEALLEEVANLVEWPVAIMGTFDEAFLDIPPEVIRLTIKENQKCFVLGTGKNLMPQPSPVQGEGQQRSGREGVGQADHSSPLTPSLVPSASVSPPERGRVATGGPGQLSNNFLLVANIEATDGGREISLGNAKVVNARLGDAKFFWETDLHQINSDSRFDPWLAKLDNVTFHAKLGSQGERVKRIMALAEELAPIVGADPKLARRAAEICKADLNSAMVYEFPELQGLMGRRYAERAGEDYNVALACQEHYSPLGPSDTVPTNPVSVAVALADKLDTLVGFWAIDEKPTGSKDPYALRRAALGVIRLVLENGLKLNFSQKADNDLLSFFHDRLKVWLRDSGARHDLIDAVLSEGAAFAQPSPVQGEGQPRSGREGVGQPDQSSPLTPSLVPSAPVSPPERGRVAANDDLLAITRRVEALGSFLNTDDGKNLLAGTKRAANILAAEEKKKTAIADAVDPSLFETDAERALFDSLEEAESFAKQAIEMEDYAKAMEFLSRLRAPVDQFFEDVMVNADDEKIRANRLALMRRIRDATGTVADFSKIAG